MEKVRTRQFFIKIGVLFCFVNVFLGTSVLFAFNNNSEILDPDTIAPTNFPPDTQWTKTYGGLFTDRAYSVEQTIDGGYIITGMVGSLVDTAQVFLIKTDEDGFEIWTTIFSGDKGFSVEQTSNLGYIITGTKANAESSEVYVLKVDDTGILAWSRTYGAKGSNSGHSVNQTLDGGYIITGTEGGDVYLIKTTSLGDSVWAKSYYGKFDDDCGYSVNQTSDGGYIITGTVQPEESGSDSSDVFLLKTDSLGDSLWARTYGGTNNDRGYSVNQTSDGGYIITGSTASYGSSYDVFLIKTDANGDSVWTRTYGAALDDDFGYSVQQTSDGGYVVCGATANTDSATDPMDVYLLKTDSLGNRLWTGQFGGIGIDWGYSVFITLDGGYIITGYTGSFGAGKNDIYLVKTKPILKITCPNSGEQWQGGSIQTIEWTPENQPDSVYRFRVLFSSDSGQTYSDTVAEDLSGDTRSFEWTVPLINSPGCLVMLELLDASGEVLSDDVSDGFFVIDITAPVIDSTTAWSDTSYSGPFEILTKATDNLAGVDSVFLHYRRDEDHDWIVVAMDTIGSSGWFIDSIPPVSNPGDTVRYYIKAFDEAGNSATDPEEAPTYYYSFMIISTGIAEHKARPAVFSFGLNSNPIRGQPVFNLLMPADAVVKLQIYNVTGRLVDTPIMGRKSAGFYEIPWVLQVSSGVYFYVLESPWQDEKGKLVLLR